MLVYILPFISIVIGYLIAIIIQPKNKKNLKLLLAFSGAFLLTITVSHLLPEVYYHEIEKEIRLEQVHNHSDESTHSNHEHHENDAHHEHHEHLANQSHHEHNHGNGSLKIIGLFIMIGIVFQIVLEYFSKGAEHGHVHIHDKISKIPWALFISLSLHALLEGMPLSQQNNLALGIAIHHLPIAIILTSFFIQAQLNKKSIFIFMMLFSLMTPVGTFLSERLNFLSNYSTEISAVVVGILFHISSTIIFESSEGHKFNLAKLIAIILGVVLGYFV